MSINTQGHTNIGLGHQVAAMVEGLRHHLSHLPGYSEDVTMLVKDEFGRRHRIPYFTLDRSYRLTGLGLVEKQSLSIFPSSVIAAQTIREMEDADLAVVLVPLTLLVSLDEIRCG